MPLEFAGCAAIVTGASSGIGRSIAVELGKAGAEVWLVGQSHEALAETAAMIAAAGGPAAHTESMNLRTRGPLAALIERVASAHPHLFALVNNAGIMSPEPIMKGTIDRWQAMLDVNVMAMLEGSQAAVTAMRKHRKPGHIINIGSLQGRFEEPGVYGISKKAAEMIGATLRSEVEQDQIRICTIIPGGFATQLTRGFLPETMTAMAGRLAEAGIEWGSPAMAAITADTQHIANMVRYVLSQPIEININEILIRPPVSTKA